MAASIRADLFLGTAYGLALSALAWTLALGPVPLRSGPFLVLALAYLAGTTRFRIRRLDLRSPTYAVVLTVLLVLGSGASCVAGLLCTLAGWRARRGRRSADGTALGRAGFRASRTVLASAGSAAVFALLGGTPGVAPFEPAALVPLAAHALTFLAIRQILAAVGLAYLGRRPSLVAWSRHTTCRLPGFLVGAALAQLLALAWVRPGPRDLLIAGAALSMGLVLGRLRRERSRNTLAHRMELASMHRSVTRALARTVEARDEPTRDHLRRVRRLSLEIGEKLGLSDRELEGLAAASLLHDIGKLAVPDGVLSKPGRLSTTEMKQIRMHPVVGAEILQGLPFPYSIAPIVRAHHERWDGRGYPDGLEGEAIPIGARILTAVDSYDALTCDRPYRRALPHAEALAYLRREAGTMFDPRVVDVLVEHLDVTDPARTDVAPPLELPGRIDPAEDCCTAGFVPLAQRELQRLYDMSRAMGYGLTIDEYLTLVGSQLSELIPFKSLVVYFLEPERELLRAGFAMGCAADRLRLMSVPLGERLSGWAAQQRRACIGQDHESPMDRDGSRSDLEEWADDAEVAALRSTLAAPMTVEDRLLGVVTLYDAAQRGFSAEDRRVLVRVAGYIAQVASRDGRRTREDRTSLTDPLTGVPNARFLWLETAHRIALTDGPGFGLLAFRILGLERVSERLGNDAADRALCQIARRFASSCRRSETLVRFGQELFLVLSPAHRSGELVERWHELAHDVEQPALETDPGVVHQLRLAAAHASYPEDGEGLESLLEILDDRLGLSATRGRTIVPFRAARPADRSSDGSG